MMTQAIQVWCPLDTSNWSGHQDQTGSHQSNGIASVTHSALVTLAILTPCQPDQSYTVNYRAYFITVSGLCGLHGLHIHRVSCFICTCRLLRPK